MHWTFLAAIFAARQRGEQQRREDGDDGNDHQQLDQRETRAGPFSRRAYYSLG